MDLDEDWHATPAPRQSGAEEVGEEAQEPAALTPLQHFVIFWREVFSCFAKYCQFGGRARRREFWNFVLFYAIVLVLAFLLDRFLFDITRLFGPITLATFLFMMLPGSAVTVRRLHDIDRRGWWHLLFLIHTLGLGFFSLIYFSEGSYIIYAGLAVLWFCPSLYYYLRLTSPTSRIRNRFGESPLAPKELMKP